MPDTSNIFVSQGGEMAAYRLIWGRFARNWGRGQARETFPQPVRLVACLEHDEPNVGLAH